MSKINNAVMIAYTKGYRVLDNGVVKSHKGTLRKTINHGGYEKVNVDIGNSKKFPVPVHKLQAYQKFGEKVFHDDVHVRHLDGKTWTVTSGKRFIVRIDVEKSKDYLYSKNPK
jgi:hypothetical protein